MEKIDMADVQLLHKLGSYKFDDPMTKGDAAILQLELRNIQYLLTKIMEVLVDQGRG